MEVDSLTPPTSPSGVKMFQSAPPGRVVRGVGSLGHLIGSQEQRLWNRQPEGLGGLEVDDQLELRWPFHGQIGWFGTLEDSVHVLGRSPVKIVAIGTVGHEPA